MLVPISFLVEKIRQLTIIALSKDNKDKAIMVKTIIGSCIFSTRKDKATNHDWALHNNCCALHNHETICKSYYISSNLLDTQDT